MTETKNEIRSNNGKGEIPEGDPPYTDGTLYVAQQAHDALMADECPSIEGVITCDLRTPQHYAALRHAVVVDGVTVEQLAAALGSGPKLQALISLTNPHRAVVFHDYCE